MLKIRLQRVGRKHEPTFRLVLTDSQNSTKSGKFKEILGSYDSRKGEQASFKNDRIKELMSKGAKISPTVFNLLVDKKVLTGKKINKLPLKKPIKKEEEAKAEQKPAEALVETSAPTESAPEATPEASA